MDSTFSRHVAAARLYPVTTQKAAIAEARAMGVMIRREDADAGAARGFLVYPIGSPDSALYAECKAEALALADAIAHDIEAGRVSLFGARPTLRGIAESLASRAAKAAGLSAGDVAAVVETSDSGAVVTFSGPAGVAYNAPMKRDVPAAELLCRVAPAAEAAADDSAAHVREESREACPACDAAGYRRPAPGLDIPCERCGGSGEVVGDMGEALARLRAADHAARVESALAPRLAAHVRREREEAESDTRAAMLSAESVAEVYGPEGGHVATLSREAGGHVALVSRDGGTLRTFPGTPTVKAVREALAPYLARMAAAEALAAERGIAGVPYRLNGRPVARALAHGNGFATVMTTAPAPGAGAAYCVATYWPELRDSWSWGHYAESLADAESAWADVTARNAERGPRSLSAAANPDAPRPIKTRRRIARSRAEIERELKAAEAEGDTLAAELAALSLAAADGRPARASGAFPLYSFRDGFAHDADSLDSLAYGASLAGLL